MVVKRGGMDGCWAIRWLGESWHRLFGLLFPDGEPPFVRHVKTKNVVLPIKHTCMEAATIVFLPHSCNPRTGGSFIFTQVRTFYNTASAGYPIPVNGEQVQQVSVIP